MIKCRLVGVSYGKVTESFVELPSFTYIGVDRCRVSTAGVGACQDTAASGSEFNQTRGQDLGIGHDLHVAELAHIEVMAGVGGPTNENICGALDQTLPGHHALPMVVVHASSSEWLVDRRTGLLDLKKQRVVVVDSIEQHQEYPHADATHADYLLNCVDWIEASQQMSAVLLQGLPVRAVDGFGGGSLQVSPEGRLLGDPQCAIDLFGELLGGPGTCLLGSGFGNHRAGPLLI